MGRTSEREEVIRKQVREFCGGDKRRPPRNAEVNEWGWRNKCEIVTFTECMGCGEKGRQVEEN